MLFSLEDAVISKKKKNKKLSLKCWQIHDTTVGHPFPQPASFPVRNECHVPSPMLSACSTQLLDLFWQPSPPLNISSLQTVVRRGSAGSWHRHCVPQLLVPAVELRKLPLQSDTRAKSVIALYWRPEKIITEFLGVFKAGSSTSLPKVI